MSFFESLLALLLAAILLLQVSRRLSLPYPAMLAAAGVVLALIPGAPSITLDPHTALALFIAPALVDAAYDFPMAAVRRLWRPLVALAVVAVLLTAGVVTWIGVAAAGLPLYAALALGAAVAPPDAAAATAVLSSVKLPRGSVSLLKGESLLNDAGALMLFSAALALGEQRELTVSAGLVLALSAPGGVVLGIVIARLYGLIAGFVRGTLGGNILEFVMAFAVWIVAERLHLSAVLCLVAFAMTIARGAGIAQPPRARVHSFAVWDTVVFLLNVVAFLLMGMQVRTIIGGMTLERLEEAARFAGLVVLAVIAVRLFWVLIYNRLSKAFASLRGDFKPAPLANGVLVGWCGMRGLITLATAFALPHNFPQRDLIVLTAFAVVLATLVLQGLTLAPLAKLLRIDGDNSLDLELANARRDLAGTALATLDDKQGREADLLRLSYQIAREGAADGDAGGAREKRDLGLHAIRTQRESLETMRAEHTVGSDAYLILQEELDFRELALVTEDERRIEEN